MFNIASAGHKNDDIPVYFVGVGLPNNVVNGVYFI